MKISVELAKETECSVTQVFADEVVRETLLRSGYDFLASKTVSVSVAFVDSEAIRELNKTYRQKDKVTDVLSFPEYAGREEMRKETAATVFLGELVLCYAYIRQAAEEDGVPLEQEMAYILSHGVLHLLGFRHGKRMFGLQDGISEPYAQKRGKT
jgi:probable rRNA maturation factor